MITLVTLGRPHRARQPLPDALRGYVERASQMEATTLVTVPDEAAWLRWQAGNAAPPAGWSVLLEPRGQMIGSEAFAGRLRQARDSGRRRIVLAIGPASGWGADSLARADLQLSLGPMTLPHELAAVVAAEQLYRALTILAGHPYHLGH